MTEKLDELSIFFPFWNEEENIENVVSKAIPVAKSVAKKWEIVMIDDGSSDNTFEIGKRLTKKDPDNLRLVSHSPNRGYGASLKEGFAHSRYKYVVFTDGDGQFDFSEVSKFINLIKNCDIVIGKRNKRLDHPFRHLLMNLLKVWDFILFGFYFQDIDCGFKMFRKEAIDKFMPLRSEGAMITTEILAKALKSKMKIMQVGVNHYPRKHGNQSGGNPRVILRAIKESIYLWVSLNFGRN